MGEKMISIDIFANEFDVFNYDSSSATSEDQIYDTPSFPSNSFKTKMECFEFDAFNYDSSSGTSEDQIYDTALFPSNSYKTEMECFEPLPFSFEQISPVVEEIDFNNFDKDIDLELEEDCADLMSTFSSMSSEDDSDYDIEEEFFTESKLEPALILLDNILTNECGI